MGKKNCLCFGLLIKMKPWMNQGSPLVLRMRWHKKKEWMSMSSYHSSQDSREGKEFGFEEETQSHSNVWCFTFLSNSKYFLFKKNDGFILERNLLNFVMKGNTKNVLGCDDFRLRLIATLKGSSVPEHLHIRNGHRDING